MGAIKNPRNNPQAYPPGLEIFPYHYLTARTGEPQKVKKEGHYTINTPEDSTHTMAKEIYPKHYQMHRNRKPHEQKTEHPQRKHMDTPISIQPHLRETHLYRNSGGNSNSS